MHLLRRHVRWALAFSLLSTTTLAAPRSAAQETEAQHEANVHFQRAVQLYSEADYRAALVEFERAYEISPHVTVLYNLGQTYYQLQNYAEALAAFERFLAEGGTGHRSEVESAIGVLRTRVGKIDVTTPTPGWEIAVDDEVVGKTPLPRPVPVSIGRRKVTASKTGEIPQTRFVEVGAGETMGVPFTGPPPSRSCRRARRRPEACRSISRCAGPRPPRRPRCASAAVPRGSRSAPLSSFDLSRFVMSNHRLVGMLLCVLATVTAACTLLLDRSTEACATDAECASRVPGAVCRESVCVLGDGGGAGGSDAGYDGPKPFPDCFEGTPTTLRAELSAQAGRRPDQRMRCVSTSIWMSA